MADGLITTEEYSAIVAAINEGKMPPQNTALGGEIYIHGGGIEGDWTRGCVALNDDVMGEIFDLVSKGTLVTILP